MTEGRAQLPNTLHVPLTLFFVPCAVDEYLTPIPYKYIDSVYPSSFLPVVEPVSLILEIDLTVSRI